MERIVAIFCTLIILTGCVSINKTKNEKIEKFSLQELANKIPLNYFDQPWAFKTSIEEGKITSTREIIEKFCLIDSTEEILSLKSDKLTETDQEFGFTIYRLTDHLICLKIGESDNVIDTEYLSFFRLVEGQLKDVSDEVFLNGVSFSTFYQCSYPKDSLTEWSDHYYIAYFHKKENDLIMEIYYAEPEEYYDDLIGNFNYDFTCVNYDHLYYCLENGKFINCTEKYGPIEPECASLYRSFYYEIDRKLLQDSIPVSVPYFSDTTDLYYDESIMTINQKKLTKDFAKIHFTQNDQSYLYEVKRRKKDGTWGLDINLSGVDNETRKSIFKGYLRRGSIWE